LLQPWCLQWQTNWEGLTIVTRELRIDRLGGWKVEQDDYDDTWGNLRERDKRLPRILSQYKAQRFLGKSTSASQTKWPASQVITSQP
jgi:hypothetical protein